MTGENVLHGIQDVQWVVGSFVATSEGDLLVSMMPDEFSDEQLTRTANRVANIVRCAQLCDVPVEECNLGLSRYRLLARCFEGGILCVMVEAPVGRRALDMALRIAVEALPSLVTEYVEEMNVPRGGASGSRPGDSHGPGPQRELGP